jgi:hypothetical protein
LFHLSCEMKACTIDAVQVTAELGASYRHMEDIVDAKTTIAAIRAKQKDIDQLHKTIYTALTTQTVETPSIMGVMREAEIYIVLCMICVFLISASLEKEYVLPGSDTAIRCSPLLYHMYYSKNADVQSSVFYYAVCALFAAAVVWFLVSLLSRPRA